MYQRHLISWGVKGPWKVHISGLLANFLEQKVAWQSNKLTEWVDARNFLLSCRCFWFMPLDAIVKYLYVSLIIVQFSVVFSCTYSCLFCKSCKFGFLTLLQLLSILIAYSHLWFTFLLPFSSNSMSSASTQFASPRKMGIYESNHQINMWGDSFKADSSQNTAASTIVEADPKHNSRVRYLNVN